MCNLVIKLQVSYQFSGLTRRPPLHPRHHHHHHQQQQQEGVLQQPSGQQTVLRSSDASGSTHQHASSSFGGTASSSHRHDPSSHSNASVRGWRTDVSDMAREASQQGLLHTQLPYDQGSSKSLHQTAASQQLLSPQMSHAQLTAHRLAQSPARVRPSSLWGFAASGVDLHQAPSNRDQDTEQGEPRNRRSDASPHSHVNVLLSEAPSQSVSQPQSRRQQLPSLLSRQLTRPARATADAQQAELQQCQSQQRESNQPEAQQAARPSDDACNGREQLQNPQPARWSPSHLMRRMIARTRRRGGNEAGACSGRVSARTDLADATAMPAST